VCFVVMLVYYSCYMRKSSSIRLRVMSSLLIFWVSVCIVFIVLFLCIV